MRKIENIRDHIELCNMIKQKNKTKVKRKGSGR